MNLKRYSEFLNESAISRDKKQEVFDFSGLVYEAWRKVVNEARDFQNVSFDLENNETDSKKTIYFTNLLRKDQKVKTEINAELCFAGGDWEHYVFYFKLEFTTDYFIAKNKEKQEYVWDIPSNDRKVGLDMNNKYCIIPIEDFNPLIQNKEGVYCAYTDETLKENGLTDKDVELTDKKVKEAWKWLENLLEKVLNERHKRLDD